MNNMSSRSHAIFTIVLETEGNLSLHTYTYCALIISKKGIKDEKLLYTVGKINLVDLAGSERMYKMVCGHIHREAVQYSMVHINLTILYCCAARRIHQA